MLYLQALGQEEKTKRQKKEKQESGSSTPTSRVGSPRRSVRQQHQKNKPKKTNN